jgi:hypothetical protein
MMASFYKKQENSERKIAYSLTFGMQKMEFVIILDAPEKFPAGL